MSENKTSTIQCVLKTRCKNGVATLVKYDRLIVTPWHPIVDGCEWTFPVQLADEDEYACEAVYSFLLEDRTPSMVIEGVQCITLAHGIENDPVAEHPFYGTENVVAALQGLTGWQQGLVEIESVRRDSKTKLVCGLVQ